MKMKLFQNKMKLIDKGNTSICFFSECKWLVSGKGKRKGQFDDEVALL